MHIGGVNLNASSSYIGAAFALLLLVSAGLNIYFYRQLSLVRSDPSIVGRQEAAALVAVLGKLVVLPQDETPTVATVIDPEKLKGQAFFDKAKKGDKILIYSGAKKAYLYDPAAHKLIDVAPVNLDASSGATVSAPAQGE